MAIFGFSISMDATTWLAAIRAPRRTTLPRDPAETSAIVPPFVLGDRNLSRYGRERSLYWQRRDIGCDLQNVSRADTIFSDITDAEAAIYLALTSSITRALVTPVIGSITPGAFIVSLLPATFMK
jgi:hypothetical protein